MTLLAGNLSPIPVALITGGAGGLGSAICAAFARAGYLIIVGYNKSSFEAEKVAAALGGRGTGKHHAESAPVTDSAALTQLAVTIRDRHARLDVLVNCAGTTRFVAHDDLEGLDDELIDSVLETNVRGAFACVRAFAPLLTLSGNGLIVNISSVAATTAMGSNVIYCASKAALDNMTKSLARALAPNIRVLSVAPGLADTEFVKQLSQTWRDEQAKKTPLGRLASPTEVAEAVVACATSLTFSTGCVIPVDGGRPLA